MKLGTLNIRRAIVAVAALLLGAVSQAKADIVVDTFIVPDPNITYSLGSAVGSTFTRTDGNRTVLITQTQNVFGAAGSSNGFIGNTLVGGRFILNTATSTTANALLSYSYAGGLNITTGNQILFSFTSTDLNVPFSVTLRDGAAASSTVTGSVTSPTNLAFNLTAFSGVNLSNITSIEFALNRDVISGASTESADFSVANISITETPPTSAVPAPPAVLLALAALPVLGLRRRFAKA